MSAKTFPSDSSPFAFQTIGEGVPPPNKLSVFWSLWYFFTGKWIQSGNNSPDLRSQMITEQTSISLVAALFATIAIPAMYACDGWEEDWKKGVYGLVINLANAGLVVSVLSSVLSILAINDCVTDHELRRFSQNMGAFAQIPLLSFLTGVILFGGITLCFWCYRTFTLWWFISYGASAYVGTSLILVPLASMMVKSLYAAKQSRNGQAALSKKAMREAVKLAFKEVYEDNAELSNRSSVKEWILDKTKCLRLTEVTERKFNVIYEEVLKELLK